MSASGLASGSSSVASAGAGLFAIYGLDLGGAGFFAAVAAGFCLYAAMLAYAIFHLKTPNAAALARSAGADRSRVQEKFNADFACSQRLTALLGRFPGIRVPLAR